MRGKPPCLNNAMANNNAIGIPAVKQNNPNVTWTEKFTSAGVRAAPQNVEAMNMPIRDPAMQSNLP